MDFHDTELPAPYLGVIGEILTVLFAAMVAYAALHSALVRNNPTQTSQSAVQPDKIVARILVGPGASIHLDGAFCGRDQAIAAAREKTRDAKSSLVLIRADTQADPQTYWDLRYDLQKAGLRYVEARPADKETP